MSLTIDIPRSTTRYRDRAFELRLKVVFTHNDPLRTFYELLAADYERLADEAENAHRSGANERRHF